jgi:hypothetical protein
VHSSSITRDKRKIIEKYFIGLFCIFQIYVYEITEIVRMICLLIARPKSDRKYLGCVVIMYMFFWVYPRRQYVVCRRFGTLYQFRLQRLEVDTVYFQPLKMELIQSSKTSANYTLTPGIYPKKHIHYSNHGESLKSKMCSYKLDIVYI